MNLENRVSRYALIVPALFSSINPGDEVKKPKYDLTQLTNRKLQTEVNILRAQVDELEKGYRNVLEGKKDDDKSDIFDYARNLSSNLSTALRLSSNAFETLATLSVDPQFNARAAVIQDIRQVLPIYEGALRLFEAHTKGEVKLEATQLSELERRLQVTGNILDAANSYLVSLERPPFQYNVKPEDVKDAKSAFFVGSKKDVDGIAQRILLRITSTDLHEKYLRDYGDQNRSELGDFLDRREKAREHCDVGVELARKEKFEEAIREYKTAIALSPTSDAPWYNLGLEYARKQDIKTARQCFSIFLTLPRSDYTETSERVSAEKNATEYLVKSTRFLK